MKRPFKRILYGGDYNPNQWGKEVCPDQQCYDQCIFVGEDPAFRRNL